MCLIWSVCLQSAHLLCNIVLPFEQFILLYSVSCLYLHFLLLLTVCSKTMLLISWQWDIIGATLLPNVKGNITCNSFLLRVVLMFCDPYEVITDFRISYLFITRNFHYLHFEIYIENVYKKAIHFSIANLYTSIHTHIVQYFQCIYNQYVRSYTVW